MEQVEHILDRALESADEAEALYEESEVREVSFENNTLKYATTKQGRGIGLRVIRNGRIGFSSTTDLSKLDRLVHNALASAEFGQEARFAMPSTASPAAVQMFDDKVAQYEIESGVAAGREAIAAVLAAAPDVKCSVDIDKALSRLRLVNSAGLDVTHRFTDYGIGISALRVQGESLLGIGEGECHRRLRGDLLRHARTIVEKLERSKREVRLKTGTYQVIFTPKAVETLLDTFLSGTNGKLVQKGASPLTGRIGEKLLDERIDIHDDPGIDFAPGSMPTDTEGTSCRRIPLFEAGVLRNFIFDLQTAGMMGTTSTGHGMRGFGSQPSPGHTNIVLSTGGMGLGDMLGEIKRGLIVEQVLGEGQSNVLAGEFSVNLELAFLVEGGEIVGRVKDGMIAGNVFDVFNRIVDLGDEPEWHGSIRSPHILFEGMNVAGPEQS